MSKYTTRPFTDEDRAAVDRTYEMVTALERALRSRRLTVQVMPDGVEIIEVSTGILERKFQMTEIVTAEATS